MRAVIHKTFFLFFWASFSTAFLGWLFLYGWGLSIGIMSGNIFLALVSVVPVIGQIFFAFYLAPSLFSLFTLLTLASSFLTPALGVISGITFKD